MELGHQLVAACLGDQDGGSGGILLELLPQPINVRLGMSVEMAKALGLVDVGAGLWDHENRTLTRASRP